LGRTTCKTLERKEWVPLDVVVDEVRQRLDSRPDHITLSGSGEPTLFSRIEDLVDRIKNITTIPVAVLTNGSLLGNKDVHPESLIRRVVYDNPLTFYNQSVHFNFRRPD
jgi:wyosine [tRNA(Phe)-imidazoG37] synthetase (radical SAM superfamily)